MLDTHFVICDVLRFVPINFITKLRASEGGFGRLFSAFVDRLILILIGKLILILLKVEKLSLIHI